MKAPHTINPFFAGFKGYHGQWSPPQYPATDDPSWSTVFQQASETEKVDLANLWCWRFSEENKPISKMAHFGRLAPYSQWLKEIRPYVSTKQLSDPNPFAVLHRHICDKLASRIQAEDRTNLTNLLETLWFAENHEAIKAIPQIGLLLSSYINSSALPCRDLLTLTQHLAWDAINENNHDDPVAVAGAVRLSILCGLAEADIGLSPLDARSRAWHAVGATVKRPLSQSNQQIIDKFKADNTIQEMHPLPVVEGIVLMFKALTRDGSARDFKLTVPHAMNPPTNTRADIWDVLRYWAPDQKALWDTAQGLMLTPAEAAQQLYDSTLRKSHGYVDVPVDLTDTLSSQ